MMVHFRKRFSAEVIEEINQAIFLAEAKACSYTFRINSKRSVIPIEAIVGVQELFKNGMGTVYGVHRVLFVGQALQVF